MQLFLLAAAGGAIGAGLRLLVNEALAAPQIVRGALVFPWATFTVNILGSFLMGIIAVYVTQRLEGSPEWRTFLATGVLGGFTTFSAFSLDLMNLMTDSGLSLRFFAYAIGSVVLAFVALIIGMALARTVFS
jgi:CrcB protein